MHLFCQVGNLSKSVFLRKKENLPGLAAGRFGSATRSQREKKVIPGGIGRRWVQLLLVAALNQVVRYLRRPIERIRQFMRRIRHTVRGC